MWVFMSNSFLSIVKNESVDNELMVRARRAGDIERVFPQANVIRTTDSDYLYRAFINTDVIADAIARDIKEIDYPNFKDSVKDHILHEAFLRVWRVMASIQALEPYSGLKQRRKK